MAIRVEHQPSAGAVGMAAYATGMGRRKERQGKYALDLFEQKRREQQRMMALRAGGRMRGGGGAEQPQGQWVDPASTPEQKVTQRAQQRTAARKGRLGKGYQGSMLPYFRPQAEIDAEREAEEDRVGREREVEDREDAQRHAAGMAGVQRGQEAIADQLETGGYTPEQKDLVRRKSGEISKARASDRFSSEEERQAEIDRLTGEREGILAQPDGKKPPTLDDRWAQDIRVGPDGTEYQFTEGKGWSVLKESGEAAASKARDAEAAKQEKLQKERDALQEKIHTEKIKHSAPGPGEGMAGQKKAQQDYVDFLEERLKEMDSVAAPEPAPTVDRGAEQRQQRVDRAAAAQEGLMQSLPGIKGMLGQLNQVQPPADLPPGWEKP